MKILKSKGFFIKSFLLHFLLSVILVILSWSFLEPFAYNFMMKYFGAARQGSDNIVIIAIDDKSISYHRWPWPREYYGEIMDYLHKYAKPKVIGFDAIIQNKDTDNGNSDCVFYDYIKNIDNLVVGFSPLNSAIFDEKRTENYNSQFYKKFGVETETPAGLSNAYTFKAISEYPIDYFNSVKYSGSVNVLTNVKGYVTYMNQVISVDNKYYPSLALRMYMKMNNADKMALYDDFIVIDKTNLAIPAIVASRGLKTPIRYYRFIGDSEYTHKKYSASDILRSYEAIKRGEKPIINPHEFDDKIVLVGANAKAAALGLEDALPTPMLNKHPGVDIQATNIDNILNNDFMKLTSLSQDIAVIALIAILTFVIISKFSFIVSLLSLTGLALIYFVIAAICFHHGYSVTVLTPLVIQAMTTVFGYSYRFILEGKNKEKIKQAMGKYLSQDIMKNVVQNIDDIKLGGKRANVTVLFADIRGFTSMSEKMTAEEVSKILNEYFTEIEPIITRYNGVINKFIGDAVMAIFGEPIQDINHPVNAVKCAYAMLKKVDELRDKWIFEGKPKIEIGIGINTGEAFVGNIGSEKRLEYTVIGDTVNLASRIESYNKVYHTNFLISSSTYSHVSSMADVIKISEVTIRGKSKKMDIYEVLRLSE